MIHADEPFRVNAADLVYSRIDAWYLAQGRQSGLIGWMFVCAR
jgi:hypothetical protein